MDVRVAIWGYREHHPQGRFVMSVTSELWFPRVKVNIGMLSPSGTETFSFKMTKTPNHQYLQMWHEIQSAQS